MNKVEQLKAILHRLKELRRQGKEEGIDEKIGEVQLELRKHLRRQFEL